MKKESCAKFSALAIFAIAMGFLEAVVVIYLRKIYYPLGFDFPLKGFIEPGILAIEWIREFATILMLLAIGYLSGRKLYERFAYFIYAFAIWDIFYYISLKITLGWPSSLLTWDLLFLIPLPWIGPVLTPVIFSVLMILTAFLIINLQDSGYSIKTSFKEWALAILGAALVLYTWLYDYAKIIFLGGFAPDFFTLAYNTEFYRAVSSYYPSSYNWPLYWLGIILIVAAIAISYFRIKRQKIK